MTRKKPFIIIFLAVALICCSDAAFADVTGAGIGATTGSSTVTSTSQKPEDNSTASGTANIGNATSSNGVMTSTPPSQEGMVKPDKIKNSHKHAKDQDADKTGSDQSSPSKY